MTGIAVLQRTPNTPVHSNEGPTLTSRHNMRSIQLRPALDNLIYCDTCKIDAIPNKKITNTMGRTRCMFVIQAAPSYGIEANDSEKGPADRRIARTQQILCLDEHKHSHYIKSLTTRHPVEQGHRRNTLAAHPPSAIRGIPFDDLYPHIDDYNDKVDDIPTEDGKDHRDYKKHRESATPLQPSYNSEIDTSTTLSSIDSSRNSFNVFPTNSDNEIDVIVRKLRYRYLPSHDDISSPLSPAAYYYSAPSSDLQDEFNYERPQESKIKICDVHDDSDTEKKSESNDKHTTVTDNAQRLLDRNNQSSDMLYQKLIQTTNQLFSGLASSKKPLYEETASPITAHGAGPGNLIPGDVNPLPESAVRTSQSSQSRPPNDDQEVKAAHIEETEFANEETTQPPPVAPPQKIERRRHTTLEQITRGIYVLCPVLESVSHIPKGIGDTSSYVPDQGVQDFLSLKREQSNSSASVPTSNHDTNYVIQEMANTTRHNDYPHHPRDTHGFSKEHLVIASDKKDSPCDPYHDKDGECKAAHTDDHIQSSCATATIVAPTLNRDLESIFRCTPGVENGDQPSPHDQTDTPGHPPPQEAGGPKGTPAVA